MTTTLLTNPIFHDASAARTWLEAQLWPDGPTCPKCGTIGEATLMQGLSHRDGLYQCNACTEPFTVTIGTIFERSHVPLHKWLAAMHLIMSSKKGMSALQIHRLLGVSRKTAWFMMHRIREALRQGELRVPLGQGGSIVEMDETYHGPVAIPRETKLPRRTPPTKGGRIGVGQKRAIISLVERGGSVRSFHVPRADAETVAQIASANISHEARLFTDESALYRRMGRTLAEHQTVHHSTNEYVRGEVHTNSIEGFFSIFKRGMRGVYQHCSEKHLHRYLAEFDFRYNHREAVGFDDTARLGKAITGVVGKRLTYRRTHSAALPLA